MKEYSHSTCTPRLYIEDTTLHLDNLNGSLMRDFACCTVPFSVFLPLSFASADIQAWQHYGGSCTGKLCLSGGSRSLKFIVVGL